MLSLRLNLGIDSLYGVVQPPFYTDVAFDFNERTAGTLVLSDAISGNDAAVVGGVKSVYDGASFLNLDAFIPIVENQTTGCVDVWVNNRAVQGGNNRVFSVGKSTGSPSQYISIDFTAAAKIRIQGFDGGVLWEVITDAAIPSGWSMVSLKQNSIQPKILIDNIEVAQTINNDDDNTFWFSSMIIDKMTVGALRYTVTASYFNGDLTDLVIYDDSDKSNVVIDGKLNNIYESISRDAFVNSGVTFESVTDYDPPSTQIALEEGFDQLDSDPTIQLINPAGATPAGWIAFEGGKMHNGIASYISLNPTGSLDAKYDILDRINQTAASTDSVYYDSTDRITRSMYWAGNNLNELAYDIIQSYLQAADEDKVFTQLKTNYGDIQETSEIVVYADQKVGDDVITCLNWANYNYLPVGATAVIKDGVQVYYKGSLVYQF